MRLCFFLGEDKHISAGNVSLFLFGCGFLFSLLCRTKAREPETTERAFQIGGCQN